MKKILSLLLVAVMCLGFAACGGKKVDVTDASDEQLQAVIDAAQTYFNSKQFKEYVELFESTYGQDAKKPEIVVAFTFKYDDVMGQAYNLILFNIKADAAVDADGEIFGYDSIQVIIDNKTGTAYDSITYREECLNFDGNIETYEDGIIGFLNSGVLYEGSDDYLYSEMEISTRFTKDNIKEINNTLNQ